MKKSSVLIVLSIMLVLVLALTFVACNNENSGDDLPEITLTDGMSLDEVKVALSDVKNFKCVFSDYKYYVSENGQVYIIELENYKYYAAHFLEDNRVYTLVKSFFNSNEQEYYTWENATEENLTKIKGLLVESLDDMFSLVENDGFTMTVKDGIITIIGTQTWVFSDFNKTKLPIDEFFPDYKDTADEYVEEDDNGNDNGDDGNGDDDNYGEDESGLLFEPEMTVSEIRQVLATVDAYMWVEVDSNKTVGCFFDENFCMYIEEEPEKAIEYLAYFLEDGKWYSLYYGIGVSDSELMTSRYTWGTTDDEYQDFLQSDGANMADTLLDFVEAGDATLTINNGSALITFAADFENKVYAGKMFTISSCDKSEIPISEIFVGYKDNAVERVESEN